VVSFDIDRSEGATIIQIHGELDLDVADEVLATLTGALDSGPVERLIVDLFDVTLLDSTGVGALVAAHQTAAQAGVKLVVINPRGIVQRVLRIAGVLETLSSTGPIRRPKRR
jgi:anti-anti-sigma factor